MQSSKVRTLSLTAVGLTTAVALGALLRHQLVRSRSPAAGVSAAARAVPTPGTAPALAPTSFAASLVRIDADMRELAARLAAVEKARAQDRQSQAENSERVERELSPGVRTELSHALQLRLEKELEARVETHRQEPVDPDWARETSQTVSYLIDGARKSLNHFDVTLKEVDCRTASCVATLNFPSIEAAQLGASAFVTGATSTPCTTTALLPKTDSKGPVDVSLLFLDCRSGVN
jgi:hypothetical protein